LLIYAHGDSIDKLEKYLPHLRLFIAIIHARPFDNVYNFSGFNDGDRCVFVARELGAKTIRSEGFGS